MLLLQLLQKNNEMMWTLLQRTARHGNNDSPDDWLLNIAHRCSTGTHSHLD